MHRRYRWLILLAWCLGLGLAYAGCGSSRRPPPVTNGPARWSLTVEAGIDHDEIAPVVSTIVTRFHEEWHPVNIPLRFVANWGEADGWRFCGPVWTVGCNSEPDLTEFSPDWVVWVVAHDLFHIFAEGLQNPYHGNPYPRDVYHEDPRWGQWDQWRDALILELQRN